MRFEELTLEGRNAVLEAFKAKKTIDKLFIQKGLQDGPINTILREAKKTDAIIQFTEKERLDQMSQTHNHQGVIAFAAAYEYADVSEILDKAKEKNEAPFIFLLDHRHPRHQARREARGRCPRPLLHARPPALQLPALLHG